MLREYLVDGDVNLVHIERIHDVYSEFHLCSYYIYTKVYQSPKSRELRNGSIDGEEKDTYISREVLRAAVVAAAPAHWDDLILGARPPPGIPGREPSMATRPTCTPSWALLLYVFLVSFAMI
jgi:hypothetical protein